MDLDERKEKILKAIIQTYLETGEPVGSRTISKYSDLNLSSATIRNEMSDLEDLGYIIQPHTSAGRIPSDKGYRFYVNQIIEEKNNEVTEIKDMMIQRVDRVELVLKQMASLLAANTNYATMISGPKYHQTKLKFIQLSKVEKTKLLIDVFGEYPVAFVLQMFFVGGNGLGGFVGYKFDAVLAAARRAWFELVEEFSAADQAETSGGHFVEIFFLGF